MPLQICLSLDFLDYLVASENYEDYMYALVEAYNPAAVANVMCTNTISISWDGWLYDCDFNQMLDLKVDNKIQHIKDYNEDLFNDRNIQISQHCYGCTAGAGSSCQGVVARLKDDHIYAFAKAELTEQINLNNMSYLNATEELYRDAALVPDVGLCCTTNPVWELPGLKIPKDHAGNELRMWFYRACYEI